MFKRFVCPGDVLQRRDPQRAPLESQPRDQVLNRPSPCNKETEGRGDDAICPTFLYKSFQRGVASSLEAACASKGPPRKEKFGLLR